MPHHLREHIAATLAPTGRATLATSGPAGLQANLFPCVARDLQLYLLLPCTSDHLLNLEHDLEVVVATAEWHVRGRARMLATAEQVATVTWFDAPDAPWSVVVEVQPERVTIAQPEGWGAAETIDLDEPADRRDR
jgi:hypothetical protein